MSRIERDVIAAVEACVAGRGNQSFFDGQTASAGEALRGAYTLYTLTRDSLEARAALKKHHLFEGQQRVTNNIALLAVKLALQPEADDKAAHSLCSDYGRVLQHAVASKSTEDEFVAIFTGGKVKETLRAAREADSKNGNAGNQRQSNIPTQPMIKLIFKKPKSAATILREFVCVDDLDINDKVQIEQLLMRFLDEQTMPPDSQPAIADICDRLSPNLPRLRPVKH